MANLAQEIISQKQNSFNHLRTKRELWDNVEKLFHGELNDSVSNNTKSQVFDPRLSSLIIERSYRVMSQLGVGKVVGIGKNDMEDARLKNLLLEKYVVPNANSQFDLLTKFRLIDMYSNIYGSFHALVDWNVKKNGYTGPDLWLLNVRDVFPEVGAISIADSDSVIVRTWRPKSFFEGLKKNDGFKNIPQLLAKLTDKKGSKQGRDSENISKREENAYTNEAADGFYEVLTRYEKDRWVDVCVDAEVEFRDIANPHGNDELPVVTKYSQPLLDDIAGLGDAERGMPMQMVINSIWNLYLDGVKMSIFPPMLLNKDNIASMSSIRMMATAKWLVRNNINNAAQPINLNPQGIATFNNTFQAANVSLLNTFGTSDTTVTAKQDAGFGKTPQALEMQQQRENTRDSADRFYMEQFVKEVMRKMVNLLGKKQSSDIEIRMFPDEIEELKKTVKNAGEMYDEATGKMSIPKNKSKSVLYDYEIVSGSTFAMDQKSQQENLARLLELYRSSQTPQGNILEMKLKEEGYKFSFAELFKRIVSNSGIQDWDKILEEMSEEEQGGQILDQDAQTFQQMLQQMQGGQQPMNQVPPMPQEQQLPPEMGGLQ